MMPYVNTAMGYVTKNDMLIRRWIKMKLYNKKPTKTEIELYLKYGYYIVENAFCSVNGIETECRFLKYCNIGNTRQEFPREIEVLSKGINDEDFIILNCLSEEVEIGMATNSDVLELILERTRELGWKRGCLYDGC